MDLKEWAKFQESLLKSQLKIIREFLREDSEPEPLPRVKRKSQISIVYDVLLSAKEPLHLSEIVRRAKDNFNVDIDRDSIISAMTKKVNSGRMFRRVAPNTFEILDTSEKAS